MLYPFVEEQIKDGAMYYILLDEVQLLAEFESVLNGLARMKNVDLYVTGSNARFLSKDIITEFRGRGDEIHMSSLSFSEFMSAYEGSRQEGWNEYMVYGGLPIISSFHTPEQKADFLKALFEETYISNIVRRNNIRNKLKCPPFFTAPVNYAHVSTYVSASCDGSVQTHVKHCDQCHTTYTVRVACPMAPHTGPCFLPV